MAEKIRVTIWNENVHEKRNPEVAAIYPTGIHGKIAEMMVDDDRFEITAVSMDMPEQGLPQELLDRTDVLVWWGHCAHAQLEDAIAERVRSRVLAGMGFVALHASKSAKPFKLLIAVPCMDYVHVDFMQSLLKLCQHLQREGIRYHAEIQSGTLIYFARNKLASKAVCEEYTHILFLDSDMVFDESIVETLQFADKDFVCGAFQARRAPYGSCVFSSLNPVRRVKEYGSVPFQVAGCGMACTMISTEIIREVQSRYGNHICKQQDFPQ